MSVEQDSKDIALAARGDRAAQASLVRRHLPRVHAVAARMLGDPSAAEDVAQEAFLRAWKMMPDWKPDARFSTWLHRVTLNLCYDQLRRRREVTGEEGLAEPVDPSLSPAEQLDQSQRIAGIEAVIAELPERQRAALVLCRLEGHTNIAAAEMMEVSVEALESLLARARRTLKTRLLERPEADLGRS